MFNKFKKKAGEAQKKAADSMKKAQEDPTAAFKGLGAKAKAGMKGIKEHFTGPELDLKEGEYRCAKCMGWTGSNIHKKETKKDKGCTMCSGKGITDKQYAVCNVCGMGGTNIPDSGLLGLHKEKCPHCKGEKFILYSDADRYDQCPSCGGAGLDNGGSNFNNDKHDCLVCYGYGWIKGDRTDKCTECKHFKAKKPNSPGVFGIERLQCPRCMGRVYQTPEMAGKHISSEFFNGMIECGSCGGNGKIITPTTSRTCHCCDGDGLMPRDWKYCDKCNHGSGQTLASAEPDPCEGCTDQFCDGDYGRGHTGNSERMCSTNSQYGYEYCGCEKPNHCGVYWIRGLKNGDYYWNIEKAEAAIGDHLYWWDPPVRPKKALKVNKRPKDDLSGDEQKIEIHHTKIVMPQHPDIVLPTHPDIVLPVHPQVVVPVVPVVHPAIVVPAMLGNGGAMDVAMWCKANGFDAFFDVMVVKGVHDTNKLKALAKDKDALKDIVDGVTEKFQQAINDTL